MRGRKKSKSRRDAVVAVYLSAEMAEKLKGVAEKERRTASTQALLYIEKALTGSG